MGAADLSTQGPMARRIRDVATALDVVVGPSPSDLRSMPAPVSPWRTALESPSKPKRVLWLPTIEGFGPDQEIGSVCRSAVEQIAESGVEVVESGPILSGALGPFIHLFFGGMLTVYGPMMGTEAWHDVTPGLAAMLEMSPGLITIDSMEKGRVEAQALSVLLAKSMEGFDALISPTVAGQTPISMEEGVVNGEVTEAWVSYTYPFNVTRRPASTTCAGFTDDGMPVGLQVVGHQLADARVLEITAWVEDLLGLDPVAPSLE